MIELKKQGMVLRNGVLMPAEEAVSRGMQSHEMETAYTKTLAYQILSKHNIAGETRKDKALQIKFDALASHDITYVGIIQTAKASGLTHFPLPYVLTNCHNSLCAVGGTINEDDHLFGLSAAKKYGGIFVPPHQAVIHTYMRENFSACGNMILGSDSHTRYGALGTMAIGEGGPELVKQLLCRTYDIAYPEVVAVYLTGKVQKGVGPQDVALAIIQAVFREGFVKNKVMEFIGDGIDDLSVEFRNGIDVMTTETTCLSSIWKTDEKVKNYFSVHDRPDAYRQLEPGENAYYDSAVIVDLSKIEPQVALPFHPSNVYRLRDVIENPADIFAEAEKAGNALFKNQNIRFSLLDKIKDGKVVVQQGIIAGCAGGTYDNIIEAANILNGHDTGSDAFTLSVYPSSQPIYYDLLQKGAVAKLVAAGANIKTAFCGPCFGAGDVPANNALSIRHTTRNFESREGSKPANGQIASVALMDARSIAATAANGGVLTSALGLEYDDTVPAFCYQSEIYDKRVYNGWQKKDESAELTYGPNIQDWPEVIELTENLVVQLASVIEDPVTTTDELIPSGETSSYRSNPMKLAEFTLSRKDPAYVGEAKRIAAWEAERRGTGNLPEQILKAVEAAGIRLQGSVSIGSGIYARKPGDGSAREQAASCQRVLGASLNIAREYATKRYRSNLINWGMIPFISDETYQKGDILIFENIKTKLAGGEESFEAVLVRDGKARKITLGTGSLAEADREIIDAGCLMNYYKRQND